MKAEERLKLILAAGALLLCAFYFFVHLPLQEQCRENEGQALQLREERIAVQNFQNAHLKQEEYQQELTERLEQADKALPPRPAAPPAPSPASQPPAPPAAPWLPPLPPK